MDGEQYRSDLPTQNPTVYYRALRFAARAKIVTDVNSREPRLTVTCHATGSVPQASHAYIRVPEYAVNAINGKPFATTASDSPGTGSKLETTRALFAAVLISTCQFIGSPAFRIASSRGG